jgi:hypothetical protein
MEGRLFLLGRNGYYNKLYENLYQLVKGNFFFLLTHKKLNSDDSLECNSDILDNLINKGDQKLLKMFKDEKKIIFLNEENSFDEMGKKKVFLLDLFYKKFVTDLNRDQENFLQVDNMSYINSQIRQFTNDDYVLIDQLIVKLKNKTLKENGKMKEFLKCFVL